VGRILKSAGRIVPAEVLDAKEQAGAILSAARARADELRREVEADRLVARREGYADGRAAAAAELTEILAGAALEAARVRASVEPSALRLAARLAAKMTEKLVGRAIDATPGLLAELAEQALVASRARAGVVRLRVHPEDRAVLAGDEARRRLLARLEAGAELQLHDDPAVGRHGCVVETATVRLDARLDTQLAALERALASEAGRD
jgi:flagellar biosynthesis/type III secretory pathway protein FliH